MSKPLNLTALQGFVAEMVHVAIEGSHECLSDLTAELAHAVGVPYEAVKCVGCEGWADAATARGEGDGPICTSCERGPQDGA